MTRIVRIAPRRSLTPLSLVGSLLLGASAPAAILACGSSDLDPIVAAASTGGDGGGKTGTSPTETTPVSTGSGGGGGSGSGGGTPDGGGTTSTPKGGDATTGTPPAKDAGGASTCKRGVASNSAPPAVLAPSGSTPGVTWWYDWSNEPADSGAPFEFVPMIWNGADLAGPLPAGARFLLGFNEPNFSAQGNLTPTQAAADWPQVQALARGAGIALVSPAVNYCGSPSDSSGCSDPSVTDPYTWLKDFFAACASGGAGTDCGVDAIAIHWYNCDLPSLQGYIEGNTDAGGGLEGFVQFGKPIWLTEFSCNASSSAAAQEIFMKAAVPYLEASPYVQRYSWFSNSPIPSALLTDSSGALTDLGKTYIALPQSCD